jgi:hypothetical protein
MNDSSRLDQVFEIIMKRMDPNWVSRSREYAKELVETFIEIGKTGPFWQTK